MVAHHWVFYILRIMTLDTFCEFFYGYRYTKRVDAPTRLLNTTPILDDVSYGRNVSHQIAYRCLLNIDACYIIRYRVFTDVIENAYPELFEDEDVWEGNDNFPGLHTLTLNACVNLLIDPDPEIQHVLTHPRLIPTESAATADLALQKWWISAVDELRRKSLQLYKIACLRFPLAQDANACAILMDLSMEAINALSTQVYTIALEHVQREQTQHQEQEQSRIASDTQYIQQKLEEIKGENRSVI